MGRRLMVLSTIIIIIHLRHIVCCCCIMYLPDPNPRSTAPPTLCRADFQAGPQISRVIVTAVDGIIMSDS